MTVEDWARLIEQLGNIPGGAAKAEPDFFGHLLRDELAPTTSEWDFEGWFLKDGRVLSLRLHDSMAGLRLFVVDPEQEHYITQTDDALLSTARAGGISPLLLMLLAIATGQVDDNKRLKLHADKVDAAAKDLMLMSVCRLCG
mgnify:CR=1 FL=1